jgi:hypothetical protein
MRMAFPPVIAPQRPGAILLGKQRAGKSDFLGIGKVRLIAEHGCAADGGVLVQAGLILRQASKKA